MTDQTMEHAEMYDGTQLAIDAIAVRPYDEEDLAALVAQVPVCLAGELASMAAWRALGLEAPPPDHFEV